MLHSTKTHQSVLKLKQQGLSQKEIAQKLNIRENTVSEWVRNSPQFKAQKSLSILQSRLNKQAGTLTPDEIVKLTDSISKLHKIAYP